MPGIKGRFLKYTFKIVSVFPTPKRLEFLITQFIVQGDGAGQAHLPGEFQRRETVVR